ncbi:MAG: hypothetical protein HC915_07210 [Anaerolineae bacterium]|nr:hypothetical protein [Anaerolineae bacterium]
MVTLAPPVDLASTAQAAPTATLPEDAPTLQPTENPTGFREGVPPPLQMDLLPGWQAAHILVNIDTAYLQGELPVSLYQGPLSNGAVGTLWLIWAFPNIITELDNQPDLYRDALQLLRGWSLTRKAAPLASIPPRVASIRLADWRR